MSSEFSMFERSKPVPTCLISENIKQANYRRLYVDKQFLNPGKHQQMLLSNNRDCPVAMSKGLV